MNKQHTQQLPITSANIGVSGIMLNKFVEAVDGGRILVYLKEFQESETQGDTWLQHDDYDIVNSYCGLFKCKVVLTKVGKVAWIGVGSEECAIMGELTGKFMSFTIEEWNDLCNKCQHRSQRAGVVSKAVSVIMHWVGRPNESNSPSVLKKSLLIKAKNLVV